MDLQCRYHNFQHSQTLLVLFLQLATVISPKNIPNSEQIREDFRKIKKRQLLNGGACLFGMTPPLGATVQYSPGTSTLGPYPSGSIATLLCPQGLPLGTSSAFCSNGIWQPAVFSGCSSSNGGFGGFLPSTGIGTTGGFGVGSAGFGGGSAGFGIGTTGFGVGSTGLGIGGFGQQCLTGLAAIGGNVIYSNGASQFSGQYPSGTVANLQCQNGQLPTGGSSSATCLNGIWQPSILGICSSTLTGGLSFGNSLLGGQQSQCLSGVTPPLGGSVQYSNGASQQAGSIQLLGTSYPIGTTATLLCNPGFLPSGQTTASCQSTGQFFPLTLGPCTLATGKRK